MNKLAVILSGSGVYDGSEINETVLTLLSIEELGATYECFAPDIKQMHVVNHITGDEMPNEKRNVLVESSRIVRGNIKPLTELSAGDFAGLIVIGGFGAAKNLSNFAVKGAEFSVIEDFKLVATAFKKLNKPLGFMCIAPVLLTKIYDSVTLTIGSDVETAIIVTNLGAIHEIKSVDDISIDIKNKVVTTPAYMLADNLIEAKKGIYKLVENVLMLCR
jgi:enhancing lycopene biosynthesis protein 2